MSDTLKILQQFSQAGCVSYGHGTVEGLDQPERLLQSGRRFGGLFMETPSNPLLQSLDIARMNGLARTCGFAIIVDEAIGNFVNVDVERGAQCYWWQVHTSYLLFRPAFADRRPQRRGQPQLGPHYAALKLAMESQYEGNWDWEDAVGGDGIKQPGLCVPGATNECELRKQFAIFSAHILRVTSLPSPHGSTDRLTAREVYYPKISTKKHFYETFRRPGGKGGYGFQLSSQRLPAGISGRHRYAQGPFVGHQLHAHFAVLAHYGEQEWAESFGVGIRSIRVSVGMEERQLVWGRFGEALRAVDREAERRELEGQAVQIAGDVLGGVRKLEDCIHQGRRPLAKERDIDLPPYILRCRGRQNHPSPLPFLICGRTA
ncbi:hypothetical protein FN846DRAFT_315422 [Sphaerosporella brunnea]|uniref:Pyridoxal phosphate-dependent transferase n=1 Tax=Sphaerosporella brunnea TaxID=1250544 RepID=A0A5J5EJ90_9PEZI|nr:hypothetical protein FN846DRAFT_315422 [Sphaerosporella brunnea]